MHFLRIKNTIPACIDHKLTLGQGQNWPITNTNHKNKISKESFTTSTQPHTKASQNEVTAYMQITYSPWYGHISEQLFSASYVPTIQKIAAVGASKIVSLYPLTLRIQHASLCSDNQLAVVWTDYSHPTATKTQPKNDNMLSRPFTFRNMMMMMKVYL